MYTPFKMKGKSPMMKKLIGNQHRLPEHLKAKIEAAPESPGKLKKSATKLKKESVAKLKKSATKMKKSAAKLKRNQDKINPFSAEYKRMTLSQRKAARKNNKLQGSGKKAITRENIGKALNKTKDKINKLNEKVQKGAETLSKNLKKTKQIKIADKLKLPKKGEGTSSKTTSNKGGFTSRKGDPYLYRKNDDGTFTTKKGEDGKEITVKKGSKAYDAISSVFKLKKSSAAKMKKAPAKMKKAAMKMKKESMAKMKKSAMKLKKSAAKLKKKTKVVGKSDKGVVKGALKESMRGVKKGSLKNATQKGLTARELRIKRNREFLPIAIKRGLAPKQPKAGDLSAKGRAELKAYEKFYSNKDNIKKLKKAQEQYFKNKK
tara:strand:+ start:303 stop:1427 length:1125 start_codon:yes stop_codon:yes gene_type:complete